MNTISNLGLLATLILPASAAAQTRVAMLARAQETFQETDSNKDGKLSPAEVVAGLKLSTTDVRGVDADQDGFWSRDEFLIFYRQRLVAANVKPAADLEAEATRILAARKAKASERGAERKFTDARRDARQAQPASALSDAVDELEVKASAGKAREPEFDRMRELLVSEARAADRAAKGGDPAIGEQSDLQRRLLQILERLRAAAASGSYSREEYQEFRAALVRRFRNAAEGTDAPRSGAGTAPANAAIEQGLSDALERLEQRAAAGGATREDFQRVRDQLIARARAAANGAGAVPPPEADPQGPLYRKLMLALDHLETAAQQGTYSREEYRQLRESMIHRAREAQNPGQPRPPAAAAETGEAALNSAVDDVEKRVDGGRVAPEDFRKLRELIAAKAQAAAGKTDPDSVNDALVYKKLIQALEQLEQAAQNGTVDRQEFLAFKASYIRRARQIANRSQSSGSDSSTSAGEAGAGGKRAGSPVATPPAGQPKRPDPAPAGGDKGTGTPPKPAPQPAPESRPKPGGQEPEKPQPPPERPHR